MNARLEIGQIDMLSSEVQFIMPFNCNILGVRSLANASRARQFNPLNPPGVGWVPLPQTNVAAVVGRAWSVVRGRACVVVRGRARSCAVVCAWLVMRGRAWSCVVGHSWSCVVVHGRSCVVHRVYNLYMFAIFHL